MKKILLIVLSLLPLVLMAENMTDRSWHRHEIRIGYGDPLFETMVWHESSANFSLERTYNYRYSGHIFGEYHYRPNAWFSYGGQIDYQQVWWTVGSNQIYDKIVEKECNFFDISIMPTYRFTFFWTDWVNLYCGGGFGLFINGGSEKDYLERQVTFAPVFDLRLLGISIGRDMFFGTFDFGGMFAFRGASEIYMVGSRMMSASFGVRF